MKCPICDGEGGWYNDVLWHGVGGGEYEGCDFCNGTGSVSVFKRIRLFFNCDLAEVAYLFRHKRRKIREAKQKVER